jgi:hypothetical protein
LNNIPFFHLPNLQSDNLIKTKMIGNVQWKWILVSLLLFPGINFGQSQQGPSAPGSITVASLSGSVSSWSNQANVVSSDNVYANNTLNLPANGNYTNYLLVSNFGFSIPVGETINGIVVTIERNDLNDRTADHAVRIVKNGSVSTTDRSIAGRWPAAETIASYGSTTDLWGETWTAADINSANFGLAFSIERNGGGPSIQARIDQITITVFYTNTSLSLELIDFLAWQANDHIQLAWSTLSELNSDFFTIERRNPDGRVEQSGIEKCRGEGALITHYEFSDQPAETGNYTYYLFETEKDGRTNELQSINVYFLAGTRMLLLPDKNYFIGEVPFVKIWSPVDGYATFRLVDVQGKIIVDELIHLSIGENRIELSLLMNAESGIYYMFFELNGQSVSGRIIYFK